MQENKPQVNELILVMLLASIPAFSISFLAHKNTIEIYTDSVLP